MTEKTQLRDGQWLPLAKALKTLAGYKEVRFRPRVTWRSALTPQTFYTAAACLEVTIETGRSSSFYVKGYGTAPPSPETSRFVEEVAVRFGMTFRWEPSGDVWGSYFLHPRVDPEETT